jgi:hypothetical protein
MTLVYSILYNMNAKLAQNSIARHRDRKLFKSTAFTSLKPSRFRRVFDEYVRLVAEVPETRGYVYLSYFT